MNTRIIKVIALSVLLPLSACSQPQQTANSVQQAVKEADEETSPSKISAEIQHGMDEAKQGLLTKNISVNGVHANNVRTIRDGKGGVSVISDDHDDSLPKAEISPQGDFLIESKTIATTPAQKALLLDYRQQIIGIAQAGMDIGVQGAQIGIAAAKNAIFGIFSGKNEKDIDAAIKPQTDKIEAAAKQLCTRLPGLLTSQQKLAAALPAFKPYATMTQNDIDDCSKDKSDDEGAVASDDKTKHHVIVSL